MIGRRTLLLALPLSACAGLPAEEGAGTPIAPILGTGFAALHEDAGGVPGALLGAAVAVSPGRVACTTHTLPGGSGSVWLRRGDGASARRATVLARSPRMDLSILDDRDGLLAPPEPCGRAVSAGDRVWAAGAPGIGAGVAAGVVEIPDAVLPRFGRGFTARMPALMGYSGGPVVGPDGRLRGLVSALPDGRGAGMLAALTGMDLGGLAAGGTRRVFVLPIGRVMEEAARLRVA